MELLHLSVRPPFATGIIRWGVTQLSRQSPPPKHLFGQRLGIHCANSVSVRPDKALQSGVDAREFLRVLKRLETAGVLPAPQEDCIPQILADVRGILGTVQVVDVLSHTKTGWSSKYGSPTELTPWAIHSFPYVWVLAEPQVYPKIRYTKGNSGLWRLPRGDSSPEMPEPADRAPPHPEGSVPPEPR